jgi:hypothetical protein
MCQTPYVSKVYLIRIMHVMGNDQVKRMILYKIIPEFPCKICTFV